MWVISLVVVGIYDEEKKQGVFFLSPLLSLHHFWAAYFKDTHPHPHSPTHRHIPLKLSERHQSGMMKKKKKKSLPKVKASKEKKQSKVLFTSAMLCS